MAIDKIAEDFSLDFSKKNKNSIYAEGMIENKKVILVKPQTYMNLSGEAVAVFKNKYNDANFLVICDDIDLEKGVVRYREKGSGGTHNGLRNIVAHIGENFKRVKIGAGRDENMDLADFVLSKIRDENFIDDACEKAEKIVIENLI